AWLQQAHPQQLVRQQQPADDHRALPEQQQPATDPRGGFISEQALAFGPGPGLGDATSATHGQLSSGGCCPAHLQHPHGQPQPQQRLLQHQQGQPQAQHGQQHQLYPRYQQQPVGIGCYVTSPPHQPTQHHPPQQPQAAQPTQPPGGPAAVHGPGLGQFLAAVMAAAAEQPPPTLAVAGAEHAGGLGNARASVAGPNMVGLAASGVAGYAPQSTAPTLSPNAPPAIALLQALQQLLAAAAAPCIAQQQPRQRSVLPGAHPGIVRLVAALAAAAVPLPPAAAAAAPAGGVVAGAPAGGVAAEAPAGEAEGAEAEGSYLVDLLLKGFAARGLCYESLRAQRAQRAQQAQQAQQARLGDAGLPVHLVVPQESFSESFGSLFGPDVRPGGGSDGGGGDDAADGGDGGGGESGGGNGGSDGAAAGAAHTTAPAPYRFLGPQELKRPNYCSQTGGFGKAQYSRIDAHYSRIDSLALTAGGLRGLPPALAAALLAARNDAPAPADSWVRGGIYLCDYENLTHCLRHHDLKRN
ncbi:hypothetical protein TSOC_014831, partial [Tetrabaena socialis]